MSTQVLDEAEMTLYKSTQPWLLRPLQDLTARLTPTRQVRPTRRRCGPSSTRPGGRSYPSVGLAETSLSTSTVLHRPVGIAALRPTGFLAANGPSVHQKLIV